ncbi:uncharacterized protein EMH_0076340 [Eimeria mitis]|uniref:Uncharacterized protein n=1 Tax=Eimeria mitis TaxID=44415 RepID=U6KBX5_9EIME|nr:uncharacterized protein EMH_0076340 [Eimeria mitis]CDJ32973.1 hypothetical protein, conserved [Eimeria mitis]
MRGRIVSVIGERLPLDLLTHRPLSPAQLAEIQVLLSSKSIASFAFTFCHLVHWVAFGQTQRDASEGNEDDRAHSTNECVECQETDGHSPNFPGSQTVLLGAAKAATLKDRSGSSEETCWNKGQEQARKEKTPFTAEEPHPPTQVDPNSPESILKEELMRLRGAEGSGGSLIFGSSTRLLRRYGVLEHPSETEPSGEAHAVESCEELLCSENSQAIVIWPKEDDGFRFPAIDAHPLTQQLQKKLEKYQANCPKPPASTAECFHTLCTPLDLRECTQQIESEVKNLQDKVYKQPSFLQLKHEGPPAAGEPALQEEDLQHKLLRLQTEQQELLNRLDPKAFDPISNWNCPGTLPRLPQEPQRQSVGPLSTMRNKLHSTSRTKLYEMVGAFRNSDQRIRALTQQDRRHHYMYSELQGPPMVRSLTTDDQKELQNSSDSLWTVVSVAKRSHKKRSSPAKVREKSCGLTTAQKQASVKQRPVTPVSRQQKKKKEVKDLQGGDNLLDGIKSYTKVIEEGFQRQQITTFEQQEGKQQQQQRQRPEQQIVPRAQRNRATVTGYCGERISGAPSYTQHYKPTAPQLRRHTTGETPVTNMYPSRQHSES